MQLRRRQYVLRTGPRVRSRLYRRISGCLCGLHRIRRPDSSRPATCEHHPSWRRRWTSCCCRRQLLCERRRLQIFARRRLQIFASHRPRTFASRRSKTFATGRRRAWRCHPTCRSRPTTSGIRRRRTFESRHPWTFESPRPTCGIRCSTSAIRRRSTCANRRRTRATRGRSIGPTRSCHPPSRRPRRLRRRHRPYRLRDRDRRLQPCCGFLLVTLDATSKPRCGNMAAQPAVTYEVIRRHGGC
jgi:hypothetical protein